MNTAFIRVLDGRIGLVVANDQCGGVCRGHCDIWFGAKTADGSPIIEQLCVSEDWKEVKRPLGMVTA